MKNHPHPIREANEHLEHALHLDAARKLRVVAVFDVVKAITVLVLAYGLIQAGSHVLEGGGASLLQLLHIDANLAWARGFLSLLHDADREKGLLVLVACAYSGLHFLEAWGLWRLRNWARWLGLVGTALYVPFELYYLVRTPGWSSASILFLNLAVLWLLWPRRPLLPPLPETCNA